MYKLLFNLFLLLFLPSFLFAQSIDYQNPPLNIEEEDGSPSTFPYKLKFPNTSVTDNGDSTTSIDFVGGSLPTTYLKLDGTNTPSADYSWTTNLATTGILKVGQIDDSSDRISIDPNNRILYDSGGAAFVNWETYTLYDSPGVSSIDTDNRYLYDSLGNLAIDWSADGNINLDNNDLATTGYLTAGVRGSTYYKILATDGSTAETSAVLTTQEAQEHTIAVMGDGKAFFLGRDVTNNIEFLFGTSVLGTTFAGSMTAHPFQLRVNNSNMWQIGTDGSLVSGTTGATAYNITTAGTISAEHLISTDDASVTDLLTLGSLNVGSNTLTANLTGYTGLVGIGTDAPGVALEVAGTTFAKSTGYFTRYSDDEFSAGYDIRKSRGATVGAHTVVANNDSLGAISFRGSEGTDWVTMARILASVDGTAANGDMPGRLTFYTVTDGTETLVERMRIDSSGCVGIGTTDPSYKLHVTDSVFPVATIERTSAETAAIRASANFKHTTTGNMTDGFGAGAIFSIQDSEGTNRPIAGFYAIRAGADNSGTLQFYTYKTGTGTSKWQIDPDGVMGDLLCGYSTAASKSVFRGNTFPILEVENYSANTSSVASAFRLSTISSGDMADGFGGGFIFGIQDTAAVINNIAGLYGIRDGADNSGKLTFDTWAGGVQATRWEIGSDGLLSANAAYDIETTGDMTCDTLNYTTLNPPVSSTYTRAATLVVAASNSLDTTNADYICDGTNDDVTINLAIDALTGGGKIILMEGDYDITATLTVDVNNTTIEGQGNGTRLLATNRATFDAVGDVAKPLVAGDALTGTTGGRTYTAVVEKIRYDTTTSGVVWYHTLSNAANYQDNDVIKKTSDATYTITLSAAPTEQSFHAINLNGMDYCAVKNLKVVGGSGGGNTNHLIYGSGSTNSSISNCLLTRSDDCGVYLQSNSDYALITECDISYCDNDGVYLNTCGYSKFTDSMSSYNGGAGIMCYTNCSSTIIQGNFLRTNVDNTIYIYSSKINVVGNTILGGSSIGIRIQGSYCNVISNSIQQTTTYGIYVNGFSNQVIGNTIDQNNGGRDAIYINDTTGNNNIQGNSIYGVQNTYNDIWVQSPNNIIIGNTCKAIAGRSEYAINLDDAGTDANNNLVFGNYSEGHDTAGIAEDANCTGNLIYGNNITDATPYALAGGSYKTFESASPIRLFSTTLLGSPTAGTFEFSNDRMYLTNVATQRAIDRTGDVKTTTTTVTNTTDETTIFTGTIAANSLKAGNVLKLYVDGYITEASAADNCTIRIYFGAQEMLSIVSPSTGIADSCWHGKGVATLRSVGATGSMAWHFDLETEADKAVDCSVDTVDTTNANDITVTAQWNNAKDTNIFTCQQGLMEYKN